MLEGFNRTNDLRLYWHIYEQYCLQSENRDRYQPLIKLLTELYSYILEYDARVICHLSRRQPVSAAQDVADSNNWTGIIKEIERLDNACRKLITAQQISQIKGIMDSQQQEMKNLYKVQSNTLEAIRDIHLDEQERRFFHDLAKAAAQYEANKDSNRKRVPGTCDWFIENDTFRDWRDTQTSGILWLSAGPGCGKSVLSRALIDEKLLILDVPIVTIDSSTITSTSKASTVCYFFFKDGSDGCMDATHALPKHKVHGKTLTEKFSELWKILVECASSSDIGEIICVLDGLDECKAESRREICETLQNFYSPRGVPSNDSSKLKFLITSRPYGDLEGYFRKFSSAPGCLLHLDGEGDRESGQINHEIDLFIAARSREIASSFSRGNQERISKCLKRLESMKCRTYLWPGLIFDVLEKSAGMGADVEDQLSRLLVEDAVSDLPQEVWKAYDKIFNRNEDQARDMLSQIVLVAKRPLTLDEANIALTLAMKGEKLFSSEELKLALHEDALKRTMRNHCGLLSICDSRLVFTHQTAKKFLESMFKSTESHTIMSQVCLRYLLLPDLAVSIQNSPDSRENSFLHYAATYWHQHYNSQEDDSARKSLTFARTLCNTAGEQARIWMPYLPENGHVFERWSEVRVATHLDLRIVLENISATDEGNDSTEVTALQAASVDDHAEIV
ncbi:hypothetical protein F5884DRAFT_772677 [Xylogone sp. PMI_703]|nr:hypothetical protein F5884DRAFT_772677 [Xylogone sp. PMI_703]